MSDFLFVPKDLVDQRTDMIIQYKKAALITRGEATLNCNIDWSKNKDDNIHKSEALKR